MLQDLLREHGSELVAVLTQRSDLDAAQADRLVPPAVNEIARTLQGGGLDLGDLIGGSGGAIGALLSQLDIGQIASAAGLDEGQAREGLQTLIPVVLSLLGDKAGGAEGLLEMLGGGGNTAGGLGALAGAASKLFGR